MRPGPDRPAAVRALTKIFLAEIERLVCAAAGGTIDADALPVTRPRLGAVSFLHPFALERLSVIRGPAGRITQHIPDKSFQLVRYYGWYSNKMRGERLKQTDAGPVEVPEGEVIDFYAPALRIANSAKCLPVWPFSAR